MKQKRNRKHLNNIFNRFFTCRQANYTDLGEFKVYRGKKNYLDVGKVISFNGDTGKKKKITHSMSHTSQKKIIIIKTNEMSDVVFQCKIVLISFQTGKRKKCSICDGK